MKKGFFWVVFLSLGITSDCKNSLQINEGEIGVVMHLLSPGFKTVQVTSDLNSFWNNTYFEVNSELKRRYQNKLGRMIRRLKNLLLKEEGKGNVSFKLRI